MDNPSANLPRASTWWRERAATFTFVGKVVGLVCVYYVLIGFPFADRILESILAWNAQASGWLLHLLNQSTFTSGTQIHDGHFAVNVRRGCDAIEPAWLFSAGILAFPASLRQKLLGIAAGVCIILSVNIVRIASLFLIGEYTPQWFEAAHLQVWPLALIFTAILLWFCWLKSLPVSTASLLANRSAPHTLP